MSDGEEVGGDKVGEQEPADACGSLRRLDLITASLSRIADGGMIPGSFDI